MMHCKEWKCGVRLGSRGARVNAGVIVSGAATAQERGAENEMVTANEAEGGENVTDRKSVV